MDLSPFLISGPSGVGKTYLTRYLCLNFGCKRITPFTTRNIRDGEVNGKDYFFVSDQQYEQLASLGQLFLPFSFLQAKYAHSKGVIDGIIGSGCLPVTELYTPAISEFRKFYPRSKAVFLMPDSPDLLVERMKARGDDDYQIEYRLARGMEEVDLYKRVYGPEYDRCYSVRGDNFRELTDLIIKDFGFEGIVNREYEHAHPIKYL
ncbi:MAG: hypothetical protein U0525_04265 [Patescibacteria group bacterium]